MQPECIPSRWLKCPRKSATIMDTFIAFKTPLDSRYNDQIPEECRFDVDMLFASLKASKQKLGLIIDLTNKENFYEKSDLDKHHCKYIKLACKGLEETQSDDIKRSFINICEKFRSKQPKKLIGVHCTYGFNRSGFLIVSYLVEKLQWTLKKGIIKFSEQRPPGIYNQDYLDDLGSKYPWAPMLAPERPAWCLKAGEEKVNKENNTVSPTQRWFYHSNYEELMMHMNSGEPVVQEESVETVQPSVSVPQPSVSEPQVLSQVENNCQSSHQEESEIQNKPDYCNGLFMNGQVTVQNIVAVQQPKLEELQMKVQKMCGRESNGFPGAQPVSINSRNLDLLSQKPFKVSWDADGTRYMMLIDGESEVYMIDRDNQIFHLPQFVFPRRKQPSQHIYETLLDGEMILDEVDGQKVPRYLVYDIIKFEGQNVGQTDFSTRQICIEREIITPRNKKMASGELNRAMQPFSVRQKPFMDASFVKEMLNKKLMKEAYHKSGGLIFQSRNWEYTGGCCEEILKWKPVEMNSVDFQLKIVHENEKMRGYLHVGGLDEPFGELKRVSEITRQYDGKIVECVLDLKSMSWEILRKRMDRKVPDSFETAKRVCESIRRPVTKETLLDYIEKRGWKRENQGGEGVARSTSNKRPHPDAESNVPAKKPTPPSR